MMFICRTSADVDEQYVDVKNVDVKNKSERFAVLGFMEDEHVAAGSDEEFAAVACSSVRH